MSASLIETALAKRALVDIAAPNAGTPQHPLALEHAFMVGFGTEEGGGGGVASPEPPLKRPRLDSDVDARRRSLKTCLQEQVLPHVIQAVQCLPSDLYKVDDIAVRVSGKLPSGLLRVSKVNMTSLCASDGYSTG